MDNSCDDDSKKSKRKKVEPSFKSKRYRDKLRMEVKALENLIPVDRPTLNKKLDCQTIYRLAIAYLRVKAYFDARTVKVDASCQRIKQGLTLEGDHTAEKLNKCDEHVQKHSNNVQNKPTLIDDNQNPRQTQTGSQLFYDISTGFGRTYDSLVDPVALYQIIDGFVLLVSTDGTIMFVTENVSKYTGFNQTDLMHRCMYSIVHPRDYSNVRNALEQYHVTRTIATPKNEGMQQDMHQNMQQDSYQSAIIENFFCRMRCYHGNTSGYIKLHCSTKSHHLPKMPRTAQTSNSVALLYCQPFMTTGSEIMNESNKEVFWSKHDLDLKFKEIEKGAILGYSSADVRDKSLYQLVHPEDLSILANVHRTVTKVTQVQTFFFRLETKHGGWLWVYCKGKVVCKNSKKFSIVFSHSPVRDEDNVFIKQEALLRRHRLSGFLQNSVIADRHEQYQPREILHRSNQQQQNQQSANILLRDEDPLSNGFQTDQKVPLPSLDALHMSCPSSWHADDNRHSPVLPNCHAVQKILNRERQLCVAEYKRKQCGPVIPPFTHGNNVMSNSGTYQGMLNGIHSGTARSNFHSHRDNFANCGVSSLNWNIPYNSYTNDYAWEYTSPSMPQFKQSSYPCYQDFNNITSPMSSSQSNQYLPKNQHQGNVDQGYGLAHCAKRITDDNEYGFCYHDLHGGKRSQAVTNVHNFYSSANVRFSMVCNTDFCTNNHPTQNTAGVSKAYQRVCDEANSKSEIKSENSCDNYCEISEKTKATEKQSVKYDIEASVYMRIVEAQETEKSNTGIDLPFYNNLAELCENQPLIIPKQTH